MQELFQPMSREYQSLDSQSLLEVLELVEITQDCLDDVWKQTEHEPPYPQNRMKHLMDVIGNFSVCASWKICKMHIRYSGNPL